MDIVRKIGFGFVSSALLVPFLVGAQWEGAGESAVAGSQLSSTPIYDIMRGIMNWLLIIVGIIAVIAFVIAGILYLTAAGDTEQIEKAKRAMIYSIVGVAVALLGLIIINAVDAMLREEGNF